MNRRTTIVLTGMTLLAIAAFPQASFAQSDPWLGTWQLNLAKSKYSPGPPPKSQTAKIEAEGQNHKVTVTGIDAAGKPTSGGFTRIFDGVSHAAANPNNPLFDAASITRVDSNTVIISRTKAGKLVQTVTTGVAQDGKTMTISTTGIDANGRPINDISVLDKQ